MSEIETLFGLRFTSPVLLAWPVMLYVFLVSLFVLMRRIMLCLLVTYLFTFYWAFSLHWGAFLASGVYSAAFAMYTICGLAIPGLIAMASYFSAGPRCDINQPEKPSLMSRVSQLLNRSGD